MFDYLLFDLDGTLTDPGEGITNSVAYALEKFGISVADRRELYRFIGPPLIDAFREFYGFSESDARRALTEYRVYFRDRGIFENEIYPGTAAMLRTLGDAGKTLIVATSKPEPFTEQILDHFSIRSCFDLVAGASMDETRSRKADVIAYALEKAGITDLSRVVMIGDRAQDILGAHEIGIRAIGVLWGYGDRAELLAANADRIVERMDDLCGILLAP